MPSLSSEDLIKVTPAICEALGKTPDQIRKATLRELATWAWERGFEWDVSTQRRSPGGVTVKVEGEDTDERRESSLPERPHR